MEANFLKENIYFKENNINEIKKNEVESINNYYLNINLWYSCIQTYNLYNYLDTNKQCMYNKKIKQHKNITNISCIDYNKLKYINNKWYYDNKIINSDAPFIYCINIKEKYLNNYYYKGNIINKIDIIFFYLKGEQQEINESKLNYYIYNAYYDNKIKTYTKYLIIDTSLQINELKIYTAKYLNKFCNFLDKLNTDATIWE